VANREAHRVLTLNDGFPQAKTLAHSVGSARSGAPRDGWRRSPDGGKGVEAGGYVDSKPSGKRPFHLVIAPGREGRIEVQNPEDFSHRLCDHPERQPESLAVVLARVFELAPAEAHPADLLR
jgi:hypothetical protein